MLRMDGRDSPHTLGHSQNAWVLTGGRCMQRNSPCLKRDGLLGGTELRGSVGVIKRHAPFY